jgi:hypothetical protein
MGRFTVTNILTQILVCVWPLAIIPKLPHLKFQASDDNPHHTVSLFLLDHHSGHPKNIKTRKIARQCDVYVKFLTFFPIMLTHHAFMYLIPIQLTNMESNLTLGTGQSELSSLGSTLKVIIKEVHVQQSLKHSTKVNDKMMHVILLMVRSVNPVQNVEKTVGTHEEDIVSGQVLNLTIPLQNNQLGQDGDGLEVDGKSPQEIHGLEDHTFLDQMGDQGHYGARRHGEFPVKEGILSLIVSGADGFFVFNGVDYESGGEDVKNFHAGVVVGVKCGEEVKVSSDEDEEVKLVGAHGDSCCILHNAESEKEDNDAEDMRHVSGQAEDVHRHGYSVDLSTSV